MATEVELLQRKRALLEQRRQVLTQQQTPQLGQLPANVPDALRASPIPQARALLQGITLGFADEIGAGIAAGFAEGIPGKGGVGRDFTKAFTDIQSVLQNQREEFREQAPISSTALEVAGSVGTGAGLFRGAGQALARVPGIIRSAGAGAALGGVAGAGTAPQGQRIQGAQQGATLGALVAPAITATAGIALRAGQLVTPIFRNLFNTSRAEARRLIRSALERDELSPDQAIEAMNRLGASSILADIGENLRGLARGVTAKPGPARSIARRFLTERQAGQRQRTLRAISEGTGAVDDFDNYLLNIQNARREAAEPLYSAAFRTSVRQTERLTELLQRPALRAAMRRAQRSAADEGVLPQVNSLRTFDLAKQELDDRISVAIRQGRRNEVRRLTRLKNEFVDELDEQVPVYRRARDTFAGSARLDDAATLGRGLLRSNTDINNVERAVREMSAGELHAFRVGALRGIADQIEATLSPTGTVRRALTPRAQRLIRTAFPDDESFERFVRIARAEIDFAETQGRILGGSPTTRITEEVRDIGSGVVAARAFGGDPTAIAATLLRQLGHSEVSDATLREVGRIIFNPRLSQQQLNRMVGITIGDVDISIQGIAAGAAAATGGQVNAVE